MVVSLRERWYNRFGVRAGRLRRIWSAGSLVYTDRGPLMSSAPKHASRSVPGPGPAQSDPRSGPNSSPTKRAGIERASFKYGYREIQVKGSDGDIEYERVPLTLEDVLHPQFGDVHVLSEAHGDDCLYLRDAGERSKGTAGRAARGFDAADGDR